jgi:hypothetical protein
MEGYDEFIYIKSYKLNEVTKNRMKINDYSKQKTTKLQSSGFLINIHKKV